MISPHAKPTGISSSVVRLSDWDHAEPWYVRLLWWFVPRSGSMVGTKIHPITTRTVTIGSGDLYLATRKS